MSTKLPSARAEVFYDMLWETTTRMDQHHKCRIAAIERRVRRLARGRRLRILEPGCGSGMVSASLARYGDVTGLDYSAVGVQLASSRVEGRFLVRCLPALDLGSDTFDVCVLSQVIEHLGWPEQQALLRAIHQHMRPGGTLILTTPHPGVSSRMQFAPGELQPLENWLEPDALVSLLQRTGWAVEDVSWCFNFFPVGCSRSRAVRALRYALYDGLALRRAVERVTSTWGVGDTTVAIAVKAGGGSL